MTAAFARLKALAGLDRAIGATVMNRVASVAAGIVTIALVGTQLSKPAQGFHYSFFNVLSLQVFFELGLSFVVLQFASHEASRLEAAADGRLVGDEQARRRLASLLRLLVPAYMAIAGLMLLTLIPAGLWFFGRQREASSLSWMWPWVALCAASAANVVVSAFLAFLEGIGRVAEAANARLMGVLAGSVAMWTVLLPGGGLWAAAANVALVAAVGGLWVFLRHRTVLVDFWSLDPAEDAFDWRRDVLPFQWRIAISWLCGFFLTQLFGPALMEFQGATEAGRMGMAVAILTPISGIAMAWISTKVPVFGGLVARSDYRQLDALFAASVRRMMIVMVLGGTAFCLGLWLLHATGHRFAQRILDPLPATLLALAYTANLIVFAQATYLRAHKQEPFLEISVLSAAATALTTLTLGRAYGALGVCGGYLLVVLAIGVGLGNRIFQARRREWQANARPYTGTPDLC